MNKEIQPFHLAIPVKDIESSRKFYTEIIGCKEGRSSDHWIDFDFFGHQLVVHLQSNDKEEATSNPVDGKEVPIPHFGVVLTLDDFNELSERIKSHKIPFVVEPYVRFEGLPGEQATMFFKDPSGNALEFKAFKNINQLFAK